MERYRLGKIIGRGSFGEVFLCTRLSDRRTFVMKRMHIGSLNEKEREGAELEVRLLASLTHPGIVSYIESFVDRSSVKPVVRGQHQRDQHHLCIVMGYCEGGDLTSFLKLRAQRRRMLSESEVMYSFVQMALALHYMHAQNVMHRDLKTQNIFIRDGMMQLGDFGISKVLEGGSGGFASTCIGTPYYMSPELFKNKRYNNKSDVWALGCVLYELLTLKHAFDANSLNGLAGKIIRGRYPPVSGKYSAPLRNLVRTMLSPSPSARPSMALILKKRFVRRHVAKFISSVVQSPDLYSDVDVANLREQVFQLGFRTVWERAEARNSNSLNKENVGPAREAGSGSALPVVMPGPLRRRVAPKRRGPSLRKRRAAGAAQRRRQVVEQERRLEEEEAAQRKLEGALAKLKAQHEARVKDMIRRQRARTNERRHREAVEAKSVAQRGVQGRPKVRRAKVARPAVAGRHKALVARPAVAGRHKALDAQTNAAVAVRNLSRWEKNLYVRQGEQTAPAEANDSDSELAAIRAEREWLEKRVREMEAELEEGEKIDKNEDAAPPVRRQSHGSRVVGGGGLPAAFDVAVVQPTAQYSPAPELSVAHAPRVSTKDRVLAEKARRRKFAEHSRINALKNARHEYVAQRRMAKRKEREVYASNVPSLGGGMRSGPAFYVDAPRVDEVAPPLGMEEHGDGQDIVVDDKEDNDDEDEADPALDEEVVAHQQELAEMEAKLLRTSANINFLRNSLHISQKQMAMFSSRAGEDDDDDDNDEDAEEACGSEARDQPLGNQMKIMDRSKPKAGATALAPAVGRPVDLPLSSGRLKDRMRAVTAECVAVLGRDTFRLAYSYLRKAQKDPRFAAGGEWSDPALMHGLARITGEGQHVAWRHLQTLLWMQANS